MRLALKSCGKVIRQADGYALHTRILPAKHGVSSRIRRGDVIAVRLGGVRRSPLVFIDANILFSAAIGPSFVLLLELAGTHRISLVTSEAETNP